MGQCVINTRGKGRGQGQLTRFRILNPRKISATANAIETSNFVHGSAMRSLSRDE